MRIDARSLLAAWKLAKEAKVDPFLSTAPDVLPRLPGWSGFGLPSIDLGSQRLVTVLDALRALSLQNREASISVPARLVATLPVRNSSVLSTREVLRDLVVSSRQELLVVGFTISDMTFRELLVRQARAGVEVTVLGDRKTRAARDLRKHWPKGPPLVALEDVESLDEQRQIHAKVVVADRSRALVGSANFTISGLGRNLEFGLLVEGEAAAEIVDVVAELRRAGWVIEV